MGRLGSAMRVSVSFQIIPPGSVRVRVRTPSRSTIRVWVGASFQILALTAPGEMC